MEDVQFAGESAPPGLKQECEAEQTIEPTAAQRSEERDKSQNKKLSHSRSEKNPGKLAKRTFESYELHWEVSRDALSTTYAAQREGVEGLLAVRIFDAKATSSVQVRSIQQAAKMAAELTHPHHITVYENGVAESGEPFVVSELVEAESLAQIFPVVKRFSIGRFISVFEQVCEVLREAHSRQLVHGNLSPSKILILSGEYETDVVKVIDFGMPPDPVQNAFYLSPEQCIDRSRIDARADIYSLGCIMYEALCGSPPFVGHKMSQASLNYLHELANQYGPDAPEHNALKLLDCIIIKCLQKKPSKRFRNVRELMDALRLVNDCICNGSTKKLPPHAEKLLLFRFLEFFDKKIVACLFSYLLIGGIAVKYIGEIQLQKNIDEAQLALLASDYSLAQSRWKAAIQIAEACSKPESLKADLHWELGQLYQTEATMETGNLAVANGLARDAIKEYEGALRYYGKGLHFKSCAIQLTNEISSLWHLTGLSQAEESISALRETRKAALLEVSGLYKEKKFVECARKTCEYLIAHGQLSRLMNLYDQSVVLDNRAADSRIIPDDRKICMYAASACNELGVRAGVSKEALHYFERANFYGQLAADQNHTFESNLTLCISHLKLNSDVPDIHAKLSRQALKEGEVEAAIAEARLAELVDGNMMNTLYGYIDMRETEQKEIRSMAPEETKALEQALRLEAEALGKYNMLLADKMSRLARSYLHEGRKADALDTYARLFKVIPDLSGDFSLDLAMYTDLLTERGQKKEALALLEKFLLIQPHSASGNVASTFKNFPFGVSELSGLKYLLIKTYAQNKLGWEAQNLLEHEVPEPSSGIYYPVAHSEQLQIGTPRTSSSDAFEQQ